VNIDEIAELIADPIEPQPAAAQDVARMLSGLPANLRKPIEDVKLMGLSIAEAAEKNGMSESAVKIGIHRGMKRLAATFGIVKPA
jgi:RNA polymerase sigma-70 factor (ECF subfamily)